MLFYFWQQGGINKPIITYNNIVIPYSSSIKFLGINITDNLRWRQHINNLCKSLNKAHFLMECLKDVISVDMIKAIYFAYFQSRMKYSIMFWVTDSYSKKIFRLQKKVI
jgi:hypothetical protein